MKQLVCGCQEFQALERMIRQRVTRRSFLVRGGLAVVSLGLVPGWLAQVASAVTPARGRKTLVVVFQRGGMDGLNVVIPFRETHYYQARRGIAIPPPSRNGNGETAIDLDGQFALHPALKPLVPWFKEGALALIHAAGLPESTRSHFDAQDRMESGTPDRKGTPDGWLNRYLASHTPARHSPLRAVALSPKNPRTVRGISPVLTVPNLQSLQLGGRGRKKSRVARDFKAMYSETADAYLQGAGRDLFEAEKIVNRLNPQTYQPADRAKYPKERFGQNLKQIAQLIKADVGLEVAFAEDGGWDHHANEGGVTGQLAYRLGYFGKAIAAFAQDLGDKLNDVVLVTMSEFGRTVKENGNRGTDHGYGTVMLALGGAVRGGTVHGTWPGLAPEQRFQGRDLNVTTDFRTVLCAVLTGHLQAEDTSLAFPNFEPDNHLNLFA